MKYLIRRDHGTTTAWHVLGRRPPAGMMTLCGQWFRDGGHAIVRRLDAGETLPTAAGHLCGNCERLSR